MAEKVDLLQRARFVGQQLVRVPSTARRRWASLQIAGRMVFEGPRIPAP